MRPTPRTYSLLSRLFASPDAPMPEAARRHNLTRMYQGLRAMETAPEPSPDDWKIVADCINLMETLVLDMGVCTDESGLLNDAVAALAKAGTRHRAGGHIRLDAPGIAAVRAVLEDYAALLQTLPHRTWVTCHQRTEARLMAYINTKTLPVGVHLVSV